VAGLDHDPLFLSLQLALAGRYSIDRELGRGGMGVVYLAREVHLDRMVAIKVIPPDRATDESLKQRFLREARLAAKLSHPNIIPIHSVEETGDFVFYVMAFVDGESLADRVRTRGPLPPSEASRILREVSWALAYAHGQGIIHRDVKPDNILLEEGTGRALVADFGIAAAAGQSSDGVAGTPEFMSPEQVMAGSIDARSDIYSLGATAFFALSGRVPFEGTSTEVLARHVTQPAPAIASAGMNVPRRLASIIDRCLAKEPENRPENAQILAEQLGIAIEQRRELPAALRGFVKRSGRLDGGGTLAAGFGLLMASTIISAGEGGVAGFSTLLAGLTIAPLTYLVVAARRLLRLGFDHRDLEPAFRNEIERSREELAAQSQGRSSVLEKVLKWVAKISAAGAAAGLGTVIALVPRHPLLDAAILATGLSWASMLMSGIGYLALAQSHKDVDSEFWARMWRGPIGRMAFGIARKLVGKGYRAAAVTHRATELSLGMASEQLFESLPREMRESLGDLPSLLARLQADAQRLRARHDELHDAVTAASARGMEVEDLRAQRDMLHERLQAAVGAMETIRLNLLRLHAGSLSVDGMTTHLGIAAEVSAEVERLIAAQADVSRFLLSTSSSSNPPQPAPS
jgi:eukaryotic-like serine/threonine-protein kinase